MEAYKNIIKTMIGSCLILFLWGCNDYLDVTPPSKISPENYLWTESQLASYTIKYYAEYSQHNIYNASTGGMIPSHFGGGGESFYHDDVATDNELIKTSDIYSSIRYVPGIWTVGATGGMWNFSNIYALNYFLETVVPRFEAGELSGNEVNVKHYIGEGYFLRAHEYFFRLRKLGDFPIVKNTLPDNRAILVENSTRQPRNEVARFILDDLDKAITLLNNNPPGGKVRITQNAALLLKARVALFEATWEKYHAGTALVPNGNGWPGAEKDYNKGYQFPSGSLDGEINFFLTQAMEAASQVADAVNLQENNKIIREDKSQPLNPYYDMFASNNPNNYQEVLMYRSYSGEMSRTHTFNLTFYFGGGKGYTRQFADVFLMENGLPIYAPGSGYAGDNYINDTKKDRDWRWRLFMKAPGEVKACENIAIPETFDNAPNILASDGKYSTSTGYLKGKGFTANYSNVSAAYDLTAPVIFRAAEAYLIYIEACYEKNRSLDTKADSYWKAIRTRAGIDPDYNKTIAATNMAIEAQNDWGAYSKGVLVDPTLYNIRRERRCELISEGQRYNDLIRWRAMDQLTGFQLEGLKVWGPMKDLYVDSDGNSLLIYGQGNESKNTISSPSLSEYYRPNQVTRTNNNYYDGFKFCEAHYLDPIAVKHFLDTSSDGKTVSASPIYQNPGWPTEAGAGAIGY